ncbi:cytochrome p450 81d1 [Euphorbia peplus]|nr:cytochrome p450 81d1 [Euphorbia peplus]
MVYSIFLYLFLPLILLFLILNHLSRNYQNNLPPSPPPLPILGHLRLLKPPLHRTLHRLSQHYGSIISLRFGYRLVVVVSSPSAVEECFTKNDIILANRPKFLTSKLLGYNCSTMPSSSYGDHWRNLRRIATIEIFSTQQMNMFGSIRKDEVKRLISKLSRHVPDGIVSFGDNQKDTVKGKDSVGTNTPIVPRGTVCFGDNQKDTVVEGMSSFETNPPIVPRGTVSFENNHKDTIEGKGSIGTNPPIPIDSSIRDINYNRVKLRPMFRDLTFNVMMRTIAGKRYYGEEVSDNEEATEFREIMEEIALHAGVSNRGDFLPILNWIDGGRLEKKLKRIGEKTDRFLQGLIDEHRYNKGNLENMNTMIDHLLASQQTQPQYYTDEIIKAMILSLILAGTDTSAVTLEWTISALLNHPNILSKAAKEIDDQIGEEQLVDESDLQKLPYLKNIILETFRLYTPVPLLLPHVSSENCTIGGYNVPRDTLVLVNSWAIHRDPKLWEDPLSYRPERHENGEGEGFKLMPFGLGRRSCPGAGLAQRVVGLTLASLVQCFEWKRVSKEEIEMTEGGGLTMPKAQPLEALCRPRGLAINKILS